MIQATALGRNESVYEGPRLPVVSFDTAIVFTGNIQVMVRPKSLSNWGVQSTTTFGDKGVDKCPGRAVITENTVAVRTGNKQIDTQQTAILQSLKDQPSTVSVRRVSQRPTTP